ncbi:unnamed protein product [Prorocentrum cordatum]|uniref:Uncharacterized protein n=1 Tax=Prorocentrum cordatum TaxID=2364126 RepID=A0ABN9PE61_9DINO|nr:unnamed protein product [Polarella glacialis]
MIRRRARGGSENDWRGADGDARRASSADRSPGAAAPSSLGASAPRLERRRRADGDARGTSSAGRTPGAAAPASLGASGAQPAPCEHARRRPPEGARRRGVRAPPSPARHAHGGEGRSREGRGRKREENRKEGDGPTTIEANATKSDERCRTTRRSGNYKIPEPAPLRPMVMQPPGAGHAPTRHAQRVCTSHTLRRARWVRVLSRKLRASRRNGGRSSRRGKKGRNFWRSAQISSICAGPYSLARAAHQGRRQRRRPWRRRRRRRRRRSPAGPRERAWRQLNR